MVSIVNIENVKHCQNGLKINNGIKQCVKYTIVKTHEWQWTSFPKGNCDKITMQHFEYIPWTGICVQSWSSN